jgi:hypothetical protein
MQRLLIAALFIAVGIVLGGWRLGGSVAGSATILTNNAATALTNNAGAGLTK